jgi:hypothetical protein
LIIRQVAWVIHAYQTIEGSKKFHQNANAVIETKRRGFGPRDF